MTFPKLNIVYHCCTFKAFKCTTLVHIVRFMFTIGLKYTLNLIMFNFLRVGDQCNRFKPFEGPTPKFLILTPCTIVLYLKPSSVGLWYILFVLGLLLASSIHYTLSCFSLLRVGDQCTMFKIDFWRSKTQIFLLLTLCTIVLYLEPPNVGLWYYILFISGLLLVIYICTLLCLLLWVGGQCTMLKIHL